MKEESPFFRAMVLMGSSIAVGCGGVTRTGETGSAGGASGVVAGPSKAGSATAVGFGAGGSVVTPPGPECPREQWDCSSSDVSCYGGRVGWRFIPGGCTCDPSRPRTPADCRQGDVFVCQAFASLPDGGLGTYDDLTPFQCQCVSGATSCAAACKNSFPARSGSTGCARDLTDNYLCGCAIVFLR
jgi:hypothetical protein